MGFFKKLFLGLPLFVLTILFLYGRKQDVSISLEKSPKVQKEVVAQNVECNPCIEESKMKPYYQGHSICENDLPEAYSAPGRIDVCNSSDSYITASFIYWESLADQIDLALVETGSGDKRELKILKFKNEFEPGFKVGLGNNFKHDNWDIYAQYTRLHQSQSTTFHTADQTQVVFVPFWTLNSYTNVLGDTKARWKMELDKLDCELGRSYYVGTHLIFRPFIGGEVNWIDQVYDFSSEVATTGIISSSIKNDSWSLGPRFGINTNWFFYNCFRVFGNLSIDLLFASNKTLGSVTQGTVNYSLQKYKKYIVRDIEEGSIGLGWGSFFSNEKWHFDLSLAYEIQRYSHTNYMNKYTQAFSAHFASKQVKAGDLFFHGLNLSARLDF